MERVGDELVMVREAVSIFERASVAEETYHLRRIIDRRHKRDFEMLDFLRALCN